MKDVYNNRMKNYKDGEIESVKKAISRTIELMEEKVKALEVDNILWKTRYTQAERLYSNQKADFQKMIELEKIIVRRICLGLSHPSETNQKEFTEWLQGTVNFHLEQLLAKLNKKEVGK